MCPEVRRVGRRQLRCIAAGYGASFPAESAPELKAAQLPQNIRGAPTLRERLRMRGLVSERPAVRKQFRPNRAQVADSGPRVNRVKQCLARCPLLRCLFVLPIVTTASPPNPHAAAAAAAGCLKERAKHGS